MSAAGQQWLGACGLAAIAVAALGTEAPAHADATLIVTTPYPSIAAQPGASVKLRLTVVSATPDVVNLDVGGLPDGWSATLRGGGFVIFYPSER